MASKHGRAEGREEEDGLSGYAALALTGKDLERGSPAGQLIELIPLSDIDPKTPGEKKTNSKTPGTHQSDHTHWPVLLPGAQRPEPRPPGLSEGHSPAPSLAQKQD